MKKYIQWDAKINGKFLGWKSGEGDVARLLMPQDQNDNFWSLLIKMSTFSPYSNFPLFLCHKYHNERKNTANFTCYENVFTSLLKPQCFTERQQKC